MNITILKEKLKKGLSLVEKITGKNLTLPILNNVLIKSEEGFLKLSTTDLELGINYWVPAKVETQGEATIPVRIFSNLISFLNDDKIELELKENNLNIKTDNHKSEIKGLDAKDFPIIPEVGLEKSTDINAKDITQGLLQVIDFAAVTQVRPELSGVYFSFIGNELKVVTTDSFRLSEKTILLDQKIEEQSFILPRNAAREIINLFSEDSSIKFCFSPNQIMVQSCFQDTAKPSAQLVSRLIEGEYPDYKAVIPKEFKTQVILSRDALLSQIKSASLFSGRTNEIKVNIKKDKLEIISQNVDLGDTKSSIPVATKGEEISVNFNHKFLIEGLNQIKSNEVIIELNGQEGPGLIKSKDDNSYVYVIMPIKAD